MRMFGFIGNRQDLGARILELTPAVLRMEAPKGQPLGWGIGFYQSGEVLLRRRPLDERPVIDLMEVTHGVKSDVLIGHVRMPTIGNLRTENTHPFRYRQWLMAQTGTIAGFDRVRERMLESQPEFLRRNVRGDTDSECFFYLFLSFLHDAGHLDDEWVNPEHVRAALRSATALVDRLTAEVGEPEKRGDLLLTNGEQLFAVHRGDGMALRRIEGKAEVEELFGEDRLASGGIPAIETTRFYVVSSGVPDLPDRWERVEQDTILTLSRTEDPEQEPL